MYYWTNLAYASNNCTITICSKHVCCKMVQLVWSLLKFWLSLALRQCVTTVHDCEFDRRSPQQLWLSSLTSLRLLSQFAGRKILQNSRWPASSNSILKCEATLLLRELLALEPVMHSTCSPSTCLEKRVSLLVYQRISMIFAGLKTCTVHIHITYVYTINMYIIYNIYYVNIYTCWTYYVYNIYIYIYSTCIDVMCNDV